MNIQQTIIKFPELELLTRDAHKLRGFFGNFFKDESPLLHNHYNDGTFRYKYPLVQYKVINRMPYLIGLGEGAELLNNLFLKINQIVIDDTTYMINAKNIKTSLEDINVHNKQNFYNFVTLWMALNQKNFRIYINCINQLEKEKMLENILIGNLLSFYKTFNYNVNEKILVKLIFEEKDVKYKSQNMVGLKVSFTTNAELPNYVGIGKSVSRGFGTILRM
ncbi:MAG: CRISPR-associated endonuclease Cas6 [bacterium]